MLAEAKDTSEIMVDLAYAAVYFNDPGMATEVSELEERASAVLEDGVEPCLSGGGVGLGGGAVKLDL